MTSGVRRHPAQDVAVGAGVGSLSGLLGVGGGIFLVPFLSTVRRIPQKRAQATSLVLVSMGAAAGAVTYALDDRVAWLPALIILVGGLAGAWLGAHLVQRIHDHRLQVAFGVLLMLVAVRMVLSGTGTDVVDDQQLPELGPALVGLYVASGVAMGLLSALFGIGGGIILIPVLVTVLDYGQQLANGTSLAVMACIAMFGAIRLSRPGLTDWRTGSALGAGAIVGAVIGAAIALRIEGAVLRIVFAIVLVLIGAFMIRTGRRADR